ncbi:protein O-mannose kinase-like [Saccostrea echinata]|uniref:protein O-mannose kinase-like n=1 Tax=Saccostrea echinata TaxID=191078 RepID=UPI002A832015|nr:protein O-mannose kinase-like [Saccostrea echinata]
MTTSSPGFKCIWSVVDNQTKCKPVCGYGYFGLYGMETCHPWLDCEDLKNIEGAEKIPSAAMGLVKEVRISKWNGYDVVLKKMRTYHYGKRSHREFNHGVQILKDFSNYSEVLQLVGQCHQTIVTEFHAMANATNLEKHMEKYKHYDNIRTRFQLCIDFVQIMTIFHSGQGGKVYAHCDGNSIHIVLWQYLLTDDFRLVISDVDALVDLEILNGVTKRKVCPVESRNYSVPFNAPEQHWPFKKKPFNFSKMPPYDEKIDIWKIPDICIRFLYHKHIKAVVLPHLLNIHSKCKNRNPKDRATAAEVLQVYKHVYQNFFKKSAAV